MNGLIQNTQASQKNKKRMHKKNEKKKKEENDWKKRLRPFYSLSSLHTTKRTRQTRTQKYHADLTFSLQSQKHIIMIRFILLQNRQGKTRLAKYYVPLEEDEKHQLETEVHRVVVNRDPKHTSFVEFKNHKLVYRRYAGLFFTLCVDSSDNELVHLESIHLFVEILDHFFANVCELDLVFNFQKVYVIVDEFILAGEVQETSKKAIMMRLAELEQIKG